MDSSCRYMSTIVIVAIFMFGWASSILMPSSQSSQVDRDSSHPPAAVMRLLRPAKPKVYRNEWKMWNSKSHAC